MFGLRMNEGWKVKAFNALESDGALGATPKNVSLSSAKFGGYFVNGTTTDVFIQVFEKEASQVTLGVTKPKFVLRVPDSTAEPANDKLEMSHGITMSAISVAATTTETGASAAAPTGVYILYS